MAVQVNVENHDSVKIEDAENAENTEDAEKTEDEQGKSKFLIFQQDYA